MTEFHGKLAPQAWMTAPETVRVMDALHQDGGTARFVGGCVRDALANRKVIDIDIATPLKPDEVIARLAAAKIPHAPTGLKHGTVTAIADGKPFEITTLRLDLTHYGRHANVKFTDDWHADAARRDFTINTMSATREGDIFDPFGGIQDLAQGRVLFVGDPDKRIQEDILRILRFFRFFAWFGRGAPDAAALKACARNANLIPRLSAERVRQETLKLLEAPRAAETWRLMLSAGIVTQFLPEASDTAALEKLSRLEEKLHAGAPSVLRRLASLLIVSRDGLPHLAQALRLSNEQAAALSALLFPTHPASTNMTEAEAKKLAYRAGPDTACGLLLLAAAKGDEGDLEKLYAAASSFRPPRFPLEGGDVLRLGIPPGPLVGRALKEMEEWWIAKDFRPGRTECLERLKNVISKR